MKTRLILREQKESSSMHQVKKVITPKIYHSLVCLDMLPQAPGSRNKCETELDGGLYITGTLAEVWERAFFILKSDIVLKVVN